MVVWLDCQESWDHPRVCGKNRSKSEPSSLVTGSPPRVREKLIHFVCATTSLGITPACAGKTFKESNPLFLPWDHPRVCGKNIHLSIVVVCVSGSPPRVREKLPLIRSRNCSIGITPACAGKTKMHTYWTQKGRDHPRVCGKNCVSTVKRTFLVGSPPRVREKHNGQAGGEWSSRITPACAGKTLIHNILQCFQWDHPRVCGKNLNHVLNLELVMGSPPRVREKH